MDYLKEIHKLIVQNEREIRALKARLAVVAPGGYVLSTAITPHGLLSATHVDTVPGGAEEGSLVLGNSSNLWERLLFVAAASGQRLVFAGDPADPSPSWLELFDDTGLLDPGVALTAARTDHDHPGAGGGGTTLTWTNDSGSTQTKGTVVAVKGDTTFDVSATAGNRKILGVLTSVSTANGVTGDVMVMGYNDEVKVQGNVAVGDYLRQSSTSGRAASTGIIPEKGIFAIAVTAYGGGGAGTVKAVLMGMDHFPILQPKTQVLLSFGSAPTGGHSYSP